MATFLQTPGAAGTYAIQNFVNPIKGYNYIKGGKLKHNPHCDNPIYNKDYSPYPPSYHNYDGKVVFLYSNPYDTILSFYRRGFFNNIEHCIHINGKVNEFKKKLGISLEQYLKEGVDYFELEKHFFNWFNYEDRYYDIMFIKYESLTKIDNIIQMMNWFNIPKEKAKEFKFKKRSSNWKDQETHIQEDLKKIYGNLKEFQDSLDDIVIFKKSI